MQENKKPEGTLTRRSYFAIAISTVLGWLFTCLSIYVFEDYTWSLFAWVPFVMGATSTAIAGYRSDLSKARLFTISLLALVAFAIGLIVVAIEGVICLLMASPIALFFTLLGHWAGYAILRSMSNSRSAMILLCLSVPGLMAFEHFKPEKERLHSVTTTIEINATAERVWENLIAFPELKKPTELIFKAGIAYPTSATIQGRGVGAIRHCNFSTGSFVEPITVWQEPVLLRFSVTKQPEPMKELSLYDIHPPHLDGYWVSKQGQFRIIPLAEGKVRLEGTTWYVNKIRPGWYWRLWSDHIVHQIHRRVLRHIREQAESAAE